MPAIDHQGFILRALETRKKISEAQHELLGIQKEHHEAVELANAATEQAFVLARATVKRERRENADHERKFNAFWHP